MKINMKEDQLLYMMKMLLMYDIKAYRYSDGNKYIQFNIEGIDIKLVRKKLYDWLKHREEPLLAKEVDIEKENKKRCNHEIGQAKDWGCFFTQDLKDHAFLACDIVVWNNFCPQCGQSLDEIKREIRRIAPEMSQDSKKHFSVGQVRYQSGKEEIILDKDSFGYL